MHISLKISRMCALSAHFSMIRQNVCTLCGEILKFFLHIECTFYPPVPQTSAPCANGKFFSRVHIAPATPPQNVCTECTSGTPQKYRCAPVHYVHFVHILGVHPENVCTFDLFSKKSLKYAQKSLKYTQNSKNFRKSICT